MPVPSQAQKIGAQGGIRIHRTYFLRVVRLPVTSRGHELVRVAEVESANNLFLLRKAALPSLPIRAKKLKKNQPNAGNDPASPLYQSEVLPLN